MKRSYYSVWIRLLSYKRAVNNAGVYFRQAKLSKFEQLVDDVSTHCLMHNNAIDALTRLLEDLDKVDLTGAVCSEDARETVDRVSELGHQMEELQMSVDICQQRSEKVLEEMAKNDRETVRKQATVGRASHRIRSKV